MAATGRWPRAVLLLTDGSRYDLTRRWCITARTTCRRRHAIEGRDSCPACRPEYWTFRLRVKVWLYPGKAGWHFATLPKRLSATIKARFHDLQRGWGSLPADITLGKSRWSTSLFPDRKAGAYLLPVKAEVRRRERVEAGDLVKIAVVVRG